MTSLPLVTTLAASWVGVWKVTLILALVGFAFMGVYVGARAVGDLFSMFRDLAADNGSSEERED